MSRWVDLLESQLRLMGWLEWLLMLMIFLGVFLLWRAHRNKDSAIDLELLFVDPVTKALSLEKFTMFWAFIFSWWGCVALVVKGILSEWYFIGFMGAWAATRGFFSWLELRKGNNNVPPPQ